ncbi:hypothetical protein IQ06DRAFT_357261 [Phaeosphaeriaceae sp. SRC1lsM3a]|nr:hypothetical protein IQ06DRAFT_357261 [Stagonospora sp. SRC1lsM3a]
MFFSKQSTSAISGKLAPQQDVSCPASPVDMIIPLKAAALTAPALPAESGMFSKWQRSSRTSSLSSASLTSESSINELMKQNSILLDQLDGLKQAEELNQLTKHKLADDLEAKGHECTQLREVVRQLTADLEHSKQGHQDQTSALQAELHNPAVARDQVVQERNELVNNVSTLNMQQASLQQNNNAFATRLAVADSKVKKYESGINKLTQQVKSCTQLSMQQQQSSKARVDAIYAQQLQSELRAAEQLKAKNAIIRELQAQLKQAEAAATKAVVSRDDKIAEMQVQLERSDLDRRSEAQRANEWQDYSNVHLVRVGELEEEAKVLTARFA